MPDNDISGGSRNVQLILDRFSRAHAEILNSMRSPNERSLLRWLLGGDYDNFTWQRNHLSKIYREKWGSPPPDLA